MGKCEKWIERGRVREPREEKQESTVKSLNNVK